MDGQTFYETFGNMLADQLLQYTQGFEIGSDRIIPPMPAQFNANVEQEAKGFGINFPGTSAAHQMVLDIEAAYAGWFQVILFKPLPMNSPQAYIDFYNATHPQ